MNIHLLSRFVAFPFVILILLSFYMGYEGNRDWFRYGLIPSVICIAIIYVFHRQIDYWWQEKYPNNLDEKERDLVLRFSPFYNKLNEDDKLIFEQRMYTFVNGKEFSAMGAQAETVPHDIKIIVAMIVIEITFNQKKNYCLDHFDQIIMYKHPFGSPNHQFLHTLETYPEDGVLIFALDYFSSAMQDRTRFYHIGYHLFADAFIYEFPNKDYPLDLTWEVIEQSCGFSREQILAVIGFETVDLLPITIYMYFVFGDTLKKVDARIYDQLELIFNS